jgi:hypothetical protein
MKNYIPGKVSGYFSGIRLAGRAVCYARCLMASDEKSRQIFASRCTPLQKSVTPFALGRLNILFPAGQWTNSHKPPCLALSSGRFSPCGALRCGRPSYCFCAPLTPGLPPQPRTPGGTHAHAQRSCVLQKVSHHARRWQTAADASFRKALRAFVRSGGEVFALSVFQLAPLPTSVSPETPIWPKL